MRLNYIELRNYRKFEHVKIELPDGIVGIIGDNGVGKSTLVESVAWALFGNQKDIVRAGKESIRRDNAKSNEPTSVRLEFAYAGDEYVVTREMSGKALTIDASLLVNGKSMARGSKEVSSYTEKKLGMDYKSFFISVFAKQKDLAAMSSLTDSERRMTVLRMLGIDRLDEIIERVSKTERLERDKVDSARLTLRDDDGRPRKDALIEKRRKLTQDQTAAAKDIQTLREEQAASRQKEKEIEQRSSETTKKLKDLREVNGKIQLDQNRLSSGRKNLEQIDKDLMEAEKARESIAKLDNLNGQIEEEKEKQEKLLAAKADHEQLLRLNEDLKSIDLEIASIDKEIAKRSEEIKKNSELAESAQKNSAELEKTQKGIAESRDRQSELREHIRSLNETIKTDDEHLKDIDQLGPDGVCPTCERPLREHHGKLKMKLSASIQKSRGALADLESSIKECETKLTEQTRESEMLKKRSDALAKKERYAAQLEREEELAERSKRDLEAKQKALQSKIEKGEPAKFDQNELKETNDKLIEFNKQRDVLMELVSLAKKVPELRRSFDTVKGEIQRLEKSIEENRIDPVEIEILETTMGELDRTRISLRKRSDDLYESILALTKKKEGFDAEIVAVDKDIGTLESTIRKLADMEKDLSYSTKLHELMMDFKLHLVARIIPMLSDIASTLLSQLTEGRYSSLTLDDGYNIYIEDGGERYILERFSGGESDLANLCLRLAISRVIAERTGTEGIDLLVLDEIFGSQDASRKRNLMTSFNALSKQFRQIFLITHIDDIREYFSSVIEVYQDEKGTSHARLV